MKKYTWGLFVAIFVCALFLLVNITFAKGHKGVVHNTFTPHHAIKTNNVRTDILSGKITAINGADITIKTSVEGTSSVVVVHTHGAKIYKEQAHVSKKGTVKDFSKKNKTSDIKTTVSVTDLAVGNGVLVRGVKNSDGTFSATTITGRTIQTHTRSH